MSKWLTTGQMIDELRVGETAESDHGTEVFCEGDGTIVHKNKSHFKDHFHLGMKFRNFKWRISPNYVSFGEAMEAHNNKKTVTYHHDEELKYKFKYSMNPNQFKALYHDSICLHELIIGKWTIEQEETK